MQAQWPGSDVRLTIECLKLMLYCSFLLCRRCLADARSLCVVVKSEGTVARLQALERTKLRRVAYRRRVL